MTDTALSRRKEPTMTEIKQEGAKRRRYDPEFKREALRLWKTSGKTAAQVARELGVEPTMLFQWDKAGRLPRAAGAAVLPEGQTALEAEVLRLRRELSRITEQRDILKKAAGILSEPPANGMPWSTR